MTSKDADGNELKLIAIRHKDPLTRQPGLLGPSLLFRNGALAAVITPLRGNAEDRAALRVVSYDENRRVRVLSELRSSGVSGSTLGSLLGQIGSALEASCGGFLAALAPEPLLAQDAECIDEETDMAFAAAAYGLAELTALGACPSTGPACATALAALAAAAAYLTWKTSQYQACR